MVETDIQTDRWMDGGNCISRANVVGNQQSFFLHTTKITYFSVKGTISKSTSVRMTSVIQPGNDLLTA